jgi:hypothetical protein
MAAEITGQSLMLRPLSKGDGGIIFLSVELVLFGG